MSLIHFGRVNVDDLKRLIQNPSDQSSSKENDTDDWKVFEEMLKNVDLTIASSNENTSSDDAAEHDPDADRANLSEEKIPFKKVQKWVVRIAVIL